MEKRDFLRQLGLSGAALALLPLLTNCQEDITELPAPADPRFLKFPITFMQWQDDQFLLFGVNNQNSYLLVEGKKSPDKDKNTMQVELHTGQTTNIISGPNDAGQLDGMANVIVPTRVAIRPVGGWYDCFCTAKGELYNGIASNQDVAIRGQNLNFDKADAKTLDAYRQQMNNLTIMDRFEPITIEMGVLSTHHATVARAAYSKSQFQSCLLP